MTGPGRSSLDIADAAPLHPAAREALLASLDDGWADPARRHHEGRRSALLRDAAHAAVAEVLGCRPDEVTTTSSGTTAHAVAVLGALAGRRPPGAPPAGQRLVASAVEHSAVLSAADAHERDGGRVELLGVDRTGRVDPDALGPAAARATVLSLQHANHEVGTLQPVDRAAEVCRASGAVLHVDVTTTLARRPVPSGWNVLSADPRPLGAPAGVGLLAVRTRTRLRPLLPPDASHDRRWPGPPPVPLLLATAAALRAEAASAAAEAARRVALVDRVRRAVVDLDDVELLGPRDPEARVDDLVAFSCLSVDAEVLLTSLDAEGVAVSSGSSCTADTREPSHVLVAMGVLTQGNVRVSVGRSTTDDDVDRLLAVLPRVLHRLRDEAGVLGL